MLSKAGDPLPCKEIQVRIRITCSMCGPAEDPDDPDLRVAASVCCCRPTYSSGHLRPPSCLPAWTAVSSASGPRKWRSTNKHWPPTWPTCSSRSGCDADWCGSAADKLSGGIGTLAIAFQIRRWSSQTLMSIFSHYNWWSVVFGRAPERERERDAVRDCWEISSMIYGTQREMETVGEWHFWSVLWVGLMESAIPSR